MHLQSPAPQGTTYLLPLADVCSFHSVEASSVGLGWILVAWKFMRCQHQDKTHKELLRLQRRKGNVEQQHKKETKMRGFFQPEH